MATARNIMTRNVITIHPEVSLQEAIHMLIEKGISGMPVVDATGKLIGIISEKDIIHFYTFSQDMKNIKVKEAMTTDVVSFSPETDIEEIALSIAQKGFRRAPIVEGGKVVGIISRRDIIRVELYISEHPSGTHK
ncbi:CBS domain-containing protein [bacterium]|nr:CBS domain-containing protein [bacterium]